MTMSANLSHIGIIGFHATADEELVIRKAAELAGWTITEYVHSAVLDRAERDLYEHAARCEWDYRDRTVTTEPFDSLVGIYGEL